jgi:hypothetical protein
MKRPIEAQLSFIKVYYIVNIKLENYISSTLGDGGLLEASRFDAM